MTEPSRVGKKHTLVVPPVQIVLNAAHYEAWRQAGISQRHLARELNLAETEVWRMLNPDHSTMATTIHRALLQLGKRVSVTVGKTT